MDILAFSNASNPYVTATTLRQLSRIVCGHPRHDWTGHDVGPLPLGRPRGQLPYRPALFLQVLPWATLFWVFFRQHVYRPEEVYLLAAMKS